jgi:hypothetical protein
VETSVGTRPLGILDTVSLTADQRRALETLADYDLKPIRDRLHKDVLMPESWIDEAILEFRRYLGLRVLDPEPLMMFSKPIDNVWHTCLLFSRRYADLCQQVFGEFVHHEPAGGPAPDLVESWNRFQARYESTYGPLNRLWYKPDNID